MEIFKEIKGFEDYEVSNFGNVRNLKRNRILKPCITRGYYYVGLYKNNNKYTKTVHRLVAETFIPNPENLPCVNHKDEIKTNNFILVNDDGSVDLEKSNLEWCTYKYNSNYGTAKERLSESLKGRKLSEETKRKMSESQKGVPKPYIAERNKKLCSKPVVAVDSEGNAVHEFASIRDAERNGFNSGAIAACCRHIPRHKTHKGYRWYYKEDWLKMQATQSNERVACGKLNIE